jgi:hypothetical protein
MRALPQTLIRFAIAGACLAGPAVVTAVPIPWSNPSGTVPGVFSWSNGQTDNGLYGSPIVASNSFTFFPNNFRATASNGASQTTTDRISFTLDVAPGQLFESISVAETGDYSVTNGGTISSTALLSVANLNGPGLASVNASGAPSFPLVVPSDSSGIWNISGSVQVLANGWTRVGVTLDGAVQAQAAANGTANIEKKVGGITITVNVPEPALAGVAGVASLGLLVRRRRNG